MPQPETLWLICGGERIQLTGRTAAMAAALAAYQPRINGAGPLGKLLLAYNERAVIATLEESLGKLDLKAA